MGGTTSAYAYNNANWGDKLTAYIGESITYDEIGNPLSYYNGRQYIFTWENGRRLAAATVDGANLSFTYNDEGIRTTKTVGTVAHIYHLNGAQIVFEEYNNTLLVYLYDAEGSPIGMQFRMGNGNAGVFEEYWFEKNLQGDIVAVYDGEGTKLISYTYDAWGNFITTYHNGCTASSHANLNPFRYRGYYYDAETGLYYALSRYYDPEIGRWINADGQISGIGGDILGYNVFAYCMNNPVNMSDSSGNWPRWITAAVTVVAAVVTVAAAATGNFAVAAVAAKVTKVAGATYLLQSAHYDAREQRNAGVPETYDEAMKKEGADNTISAACHQFTADGELNRKVCWPDGKEGIYDSDGNLVTDSRDKGTYNSFVPNNLWNGILHIGFDVAPWIFFGNDDDDSTNILQRLISLFGEG